MPQNKALELEHAKKILHNPEFYWNSATSAGLKGSLRRADWIIQKASLSSGRRVLEVGCGTGFFSEIFSKTGTQLDALDISPELLQKAQERCGGRVHFELGDVEALKFADETFDAVIGIRVLHHLDMDPSFKEIARVLKKGGAIAFCEPNMLNPQIMIQKNIPIIKKWMGDTPDETAFFKWPLKRFLKKRGFENIEIEPFDFLHPWIPGAMVPAAQSLGSFLEKCPGLREIAGSLQIFARKA